MRYAMPKRKSRPTVAPPTEGAIQVWWFRSSSNPNTEYQTLLYPGGQTSCNCPGWTRRVDAQGRRMCRHTNDVLAGIADRTAERTLRLDTPTTPIAPPTSSKPQRPTGGRTVQFDD